MKYQVEITVDTNDADYNTEVSVLTKEEVNLLRPLLIEIKNFKAYSVTVNDMSWSHHHNFPCGEHCPREDLGEKTVEELYPDHLEALNILRDMCPYGEYGFHTIESVYISPLQNKERLV